MQGSNIYVIYPLLFSSLFLLTCTSFFPLSPNRSLLPRLTNYCVYIPHSTPPIPPLPDVGSGERQSRRPTEDRTDAERLGREAETEEQGARGAAASSLRVTGEKKLPGLM